MYELVVAGVLMMSFSNFKELIEFFVSTTYPCGARRRLFGMDEVCERTGRYGFRNRVLEDYNKNGRDRNGDGTPKKTVVMHGREVIDPGVIWDAVLERRADITDDGYMACSRVYRLYYKRMRGYCRPVEESSAPQAAHRYRNGAVPCTGKVRLRGRMSTSSCGRTARLLTAVHENGDEIVKFPASAEDVRPRKRRGDGDRSWKSGKYRHQWEVHAGKADRREMLIG